MKDKKTVLHLTDVFLRPTETFVYNSIIGVKGYRKLILTNKRENKGIFPFPEKDIIIFPYILVKDREYHARGIGTKAYYMAKKAINPLLKPWIGKYFQRLVRNNNIKIMHSHFGFNGDRFINVKKNIGVSLATSFHGYDTAPVLRASPRFYDRLFEEGDLMLVEGNAMKKAFTNHGYPSSKIKIHHLGVDIGKFPYKKRELMPNEKVKIIFVGRFVEKKGIDYLVRAFHRAYLKNNNMELTLIGDGPEMPKIRKLIEEKKMQKIICLKGFVPPDRINEEMEKAHIFAHPSLTAPDGDTEGGTPTGILEAQAAGMPILSTLHADIPEAVLNGKSGLLCLEMDVNGLAKNMKWLAENPSAWPKMGKAGREHVSKEYNYLVQGERLSKIYDSLL